MIHPQTIRALKSLGGIGLTLSCLQTNAWIGIEFIFVFSSKLKKLSVEANNINAYLIALNKCFAHWINKINVKRHSANLQLLLAIYPTDIYCYVNAMMKHMSKDVLKKKLRKNF